MLEYVEVKCVDPDELRLKKNVLLAYTDLTAAGSRALLGIDMRMEYFKMDIPELAKHKPACERDDDLSPTEQHFQCLQVLNCKYEEFSLVIVNTVIAGDESHYVANRIMDLCVQSNVEKVTVFTVLKLDLPEVEKHKMYENCFNSQPVTAHPSIPHDAKICDPFLSTLLQMLQVENIPANCLTIPGHRGSLGQACNHDGSKQHIATFQDTVNALYKLQFSKERSYNLVYRGKNDDDLDMASMIYL